MYMSVRPTESAVAAATAGINHQACACQYTKASSQQVHSTPYWFIMMSSSPTAYPSTLSQPVPVSQNTTRSHWRCLGSVQQTIRVRFGPTPSLNGTVSTPLLPRGLSRQLTPAKACLSSSRWRCQICAWADHLRPCQPHHPSMPLYPAQTGSPNLACPPSCCVTSCLA